MLAQQQTLFVEMIALKREGQIQKANQMAQQEAYAAHIARQSAQHQAKCLDLEYNARQLAEKNALMAEERASEFEAQTRRLELDLAEASSSLERLSKEQKKEASPTLLQPIGASLMLGDDCEASPTLVNELEASPKLEEKERALERKHNARRR